VHLTMQCVARWVESESAASADKLHAMAQDTKSWLLLLSGALVFFMQVNEKKMVLAVRPYGQLWTLHCTTTTAFSLATCSMYVSLSVHI
jgi:hypothetical protein